MTIVDRPHRLQTERTPRRGVRGVAIVGLLAALTLCSCGKAAAPTPPALPAAAVAGPARPALWHRPGYVRRPIVDVHAHLSIYGVDRIEKLLGDVGIAAIVNLSGGSGRDDGKQWLLSRILSERLGGRVINLANMDWQGCCDAAWSTRESGRMRKAATDYGFRGLKISKGLGLGVTDARDALVAVDDVRLDPIWRTAADLGWPVAIHIADPKAFWAPPTPDNERYAELSVHPGWSWYRRGVPEWSAMLDAGERLFARHPKTTFIAVHFGNAAEEPERVAAMLEKLPNVVLDLSARIGEVGRHPAEQIRALIERYSGRVLFGTDIGISDDYLMLGSNGAIEPTNHDILPFYEAHFRYLEGSERQIAHPSPIQGAWKVDAIGLPDAVLDKIYAGNAARIFGLDLKALARSPSGAMAAPVPAVAPASSR
jgi:predicted TIM-barrel fold metal-dependent hydrolase